MPQAIELRRDTLMLISIQTGEPIADFQAMLENWQAFESDSNNPLVIVIDFKADNGRHMTWAEMSKRIFDGSFKHVFGENPNMFMPVVRI